MTQSNLDDEEIPLLKYLIYQKKLELQEKEKLVQTCDSSEQITLATAGTIADTKSDCLGSVPLSPFLDICVALHLDPNKQFPSRLIEAEATNNSARMNLKRLRAEALRQAALLKKQIRQAEDMLRCAGSQPGTIDHELHEVLKHYASLDIDITIDEGMGIALAHMYRETADEATLMRIVTSGRFALREVGNCAADVVFDPDLRGQMAERKKQVGFWGRHTVMREYLWIAENSPDHSTVKAYVIESRRLRDLPEHILYGLVVCGEGHAMRILKVEKDGLRLVEGNYDGRLNVGRYLPFSQVVIKGREIVVYSRQPSEREGLQKEFNPYDYTNSDAVGYESGKEMLDDINSPGAAFFKLKSAKVFTRLPLRLRDSLSILRFISGKSYDITRYADLVDSAGKLFPGQSREKIISAFLQSALRNPTGQIVVSTVTSSQGYHRLLSRFTCAVPVDLAKQMFVYFKEEGGEEISLHQLKEITDATRREHGDMVPRILLLTLQEFMALGEPARRAAAILTPRRDAEGRKANSHSHFEEQLMRTCQDDPASLMEEESKQRVTLKELMQNPLQALIMIERPFDLLGICTRLTTEELAILERYPVMGSDDQLKKLIARKFEIRKHYIK